MVNFSLSQLEYIVALDTHRHFVTASEKCFVTQPTLSMQIRKIENTLGVTLFDRSKQPVIPTDIGKKIIHQARITLSNAQRIEEVVSEFKKTVSGTLRLGIIPTLSSFLIPQFAGSFSRKFPLVELEVKELITRQVVEELLKDELDIGLIVTPLDEPGIEERPLFYEEIKIYQNIETSTLPTPVFMEDLGRTKLWMLSEGHCFRDQVINLCQIQSQNDNGGLKFESGSLETLRKMVDTEGGVTFLPELAARELPETKQKQLSSLAPQKVCREISLVYARSYAKKRLIDLLEAAILKVVDLPKEIMPGFSCVDWK